MLFWKTKTKLKAKTNFILARGNIKRWDFCILEDISKHVTLIQLMDSLVNVNYAISVVGYWIFDSNYEKALVTNRKSLDMICALSIGEKQVDTLEKNLMWGTFS